MPTSKFIFKRLGSRVLFKCPDCGTLCEVGTSQIAGQKSIRCPMVACDFCETIDLTEVVTETVP